MFLKIFNYFLLLLMVTSLVPALFFFSTWYSTLFLVGLILFGVCVQLGYLMRVLGDTGWQVGAILLGYLNALAVIGFFLIFVYLGVGVLGTILCFVNSIAVYLLSRVYLVEESFK